jgi:hypothetical protein
MLDFNNFREWVARASRPPLSASCRQASEGSRTGCTVSGKPPLSKSEREMEICQTCNPAPESLRYRGGQEGVTAVLHPSGISIVRFGDPARNRTGIESSHRPPHVILSGAERSRKISQTSRDEATTRCMLARPLPRPIRSKRVRCHLLSDFARGATRLLPQSDNEIPFPRRKPGPTNILIPES